MQKGEQASKKQASKEEREEKERGRRRLINERIGEGGRQQKVRETWSREQTQRLAHMLIKVVKVVSSGSRIW